MSIRANSSPMLRVVDHADYQGCLPHTDRAESFLSDLGQIVSLTNSPEAKFFATLYADGEVSDHSIVLCGEEILSQFLSWFQWSETASRSYVRSPRLSEHVDIFFLDIFKGSKTRERRQKRKAAKWTNLIFRSINRFRKFLLMKQSGTWKYN